MHWSNSPLLRASSKTGETAGVRRGRAGGEGHRGLSMACTRRFWCCHVAGVAVQAEGCQDGMLTSFLWKVMGSHWTGSLICMAGCKVGGVDPALMVRVYRTGGGVSWDSVGSSALSVLRGPLGCEGGAEALAGTGEGAPGGTAQEVGPFTPGEPLPHLVAVHFLCRLRRVPVLQGIHGRGGTRYLGAEFSLPSPPNQPTCSPSSTTLTALVSLSVNQGALRGAGIADAGRVAPRRPRFMLAFGSTAAVPAAPPLCHLDPDGSCRLLSPWLPRFLRQELGVNPL